ncbi:group III truncated hemoglobin [Chitinophagaceae bacterium MMS25-I14]
MDIQQQEDIEILVNRFYDKVRGDETIGHIFQGIIGENWAHHLPVMYRFWGTVLLGEPGYSGNTIAKHIDVDRRFMLGQEHFDRWIRLWNETVTALYSGPKADEAMKRAHLMLQLIKMKVEDARKTNFIQ